MSRPTERRLIQTGPLPGCWYARAPRNDGLGVGLFVTFNDPAHSRQLSPPEPWRRQLNQRAVGIAEIKAHATARPAIFADDLDIARRQSRAPGVEIGGGDRQRQMQAPASVVAGNHAAVLDDVGLGRSSLKHEQDTSRRDREGDQPWRVDQRLEIQPIAIKRPPSVSDRARRAKFRADRRLTVRGVPRTSSSPSSQSSPLGACALSRAGRTRKETPLRDQFLNQNSASSCRQTHHPRGNSRLAPQPRPNRGRRPPRRAATLPPSAWRRGSRSG